MNEGNPDPKHVIAEGYDRLGPAFSAWNSARPPVVRSWFLGEVLSRLPEGSDVLELGCGPGTDAAALSTRRRYVGVDLSAVQLAVARSRVPDARFIRGDFTSIGFLPGSFDGVVAFYAFMHVPRAELAPSLERIFDWLRPGGRLMVTMTTTESEDRVEEWLDVQMFFAGTSPETTWRFLTEAGFRIELSEIREEIEERYGPTDFHWVIARKPEVRDGSGAPEQSPRAG